MKNDTLQLFSISVENYWVTLTGQWLCSVRKHTDDLTAAYGLLRGTQVDRIGSGE